MHEITESFLEQSRPMLRRIAYDILRPNTQYVDDAVQDAVVSAWIHRDSYNGRATPTTWLCQILRNACIDAFRKHKRKGKTEIGVYHEELSRSKYRSSNPEWVAVTRMTLENAMASVEAMGEASAWGVQEIRRLLAGEDGSAPEGMCRVTGKTRLVRARRKLMEVLA